MLRASRPFGGFSDDKSRARRKTTTINCGLNLTHSTLPAILCIHLPPLLMALYTDSTRHRRHLRATRVGPPFHSVAPVLHHPPSNPLHFTLREWWWWSSSSTQRWTTLLLKQRPPARRIQTLDAPCVRRRVPPVRPPLHAPSTRSNA